MLIEKTNEEIIAYLAKDNALAHHALEEVLHTTPDKFRPLILDLEDMQMRGEQIEAAYTGHARRNSKLFIESCALRRPEMVAMVNGMCPNSYPQAREHGEQRTVPPIDGAIKNILQEAQDEGRLQRLDEGADAIHTLFMAMLTKMQTERSYVANFKLNLGGQGWAHFQVALVNILNPDGTPYDKQPRDEVANMIQPGGKGAVAGMPKKEGETRDLQPNKVREFTKEEMNLMEGVAAQIFEGKKAVVENRDVSITPKTGHDRVTVKRVATPEEINEAFEKKRKELGRPMTYGEVQALDAELAQVIERG